MAWLASLLGGLFSAIVEGLRAAISEHRRDEAFRRMGEAEQSAKTSEAGNAAQERMRQAGASVHDRQRVSDRLRDGSA